MSECGGGASREPLLRDVESQGVWGQPPNLEDIEDVVTEQCTVTQLLEERPTEVLRYLQAKGVSKLGEFQEDDGIVFPAFEDGQLLAFGSDRRKLDYESEWRRRLREDGGGRSTKDGWSNTVAVEAYVVTVRDAAGPDKRGLLHPLLKRYQAKRCSYAVFALPAVQAVIKFKWATFARRLLMMELCCFLLWLVSFNVFTIAFQDEDLSLSLRELLHSTRGRVTVAAELMALVGMAPFLLLEVGTIPAYGLGWLDIWNSLDLLTYCIQIGVTVMHLGRFYTKSEWLTTLLAVQCILLVFRLQFYTQAFHAVRFAYLPIIKEVWGDLRPYFYFMLVIMWGFACAFNIALRHDQEGQQEYSSIVTSFLAMFEHQYGDMEFKPMWQSKSPKIATALAVAYTFVQGIVIINLLLGIVINSLEKVTEHQDMKMLLNQARVIDELESTMPRWMERRHPDWFPAFVHMLRINPDKLDKVEQDALWTMMGRDEPHILQEAGSNPLTDGHPRHVNGDADGESDGDGEEGGQEELGSGKEESKGGKEGGKPGSPSGNDSAGGGGGSEQAGTCSRALQRAGSAAAGAGGAAAAAADAAAVREQVTAMQRQLEEQGHLLRTICAQLAPAAPAGAREAGSLAGGAASWQSHSGTGN